MSVKDLLNKREKARVIQEKKGDSPSTLELIEKHLEKLREQDNSTALARIEEKLDKLTAGSEEERKARLHVLELFAQVLKQKVG